jgi:quercetin dioxygenase-like cupin family protein
MKRGWFIGNFVPSVLKTNRFEVGYRKHRRGESWPAHIHRKTEEINYLVRGEMLVNGMKYTAGEIFVIGKGEAARPEFLEDCELVVVKIPSLPKDKHEII